MHKRSEDPIIPFNVTFLGTGGTIPTHKRALAAFYVIRGGDKWLFDCGEGTQRQLWAATGGLPDLDGIFLTHFHSDHTWGLPSILATMALYGRTRPVSVYGPPGMRDKLQALYSMMNRDTRALIRWCETPPDSLAAGMGDYDIRSFQTKHARGLAQGYVIKEHDRPGHIDAGLCAAAGLSGREIGRVKAGEEVKGVRPADVIGPPIMGRKLVITGDTAPTPATLVEASSATLLIHDATFLKDQGIDKEHSTAEDAGAVARQARVKQLAPTHIATRNKIRDVAEEASAARGLGTYVPRDLDVYDLTREEWFDPHRWRLHNR